MSRPHEPVPHESVQVIKQRRDAALTTLVNGVPYISFLGVKFDRRGDELTAVLPFDDKHIGNQMRSEERRVGKECRL